MNKKLQNWPAIHAFFFGAILLLWQYDHEQSIAKSQTFKKSFSQASHGMIAEDTVTRPVMDNIERELNSYKILPSPGLLEIVYKLNPGLIDSNIVQLKFMMPKVPQLMEVEKNGFYQQFERDKSPDQYLQKILRDSIAYCLNLFETTVWSEKIGFQKQEDRGRLEVLGNVMYSDLRGYKIENVSRVKAIELIKLLNGCSLIFESGRKRSSFTPEEINTIYYIARQLSFILGTENSKRYYLQMEEAGYIPDAPIKDHGPFNDPDVAVTQAATGLRPFSVAIYLAKDGKVISEGPDVSKRFRVMCYPPALVGFEPTRRDCDAPATFAYIALSNAAYAFMVIDLRTGKKMRFVKDNKYSEIINTEPAFKNVLFEQLPIFQVALYIKED